MTDRFLRYHTWVPRLLGLVLLIAASFKAFELTRGDVAETSWLTSRVVLSVAAECEFLLGLWLWSGIRAGTVRNWALVFFALLFQVALYQLVSGQESCHCFGKLQIPPAAMLAFDAVGLIALLLWRANRISLVTANTHACRFAIFGTIALLVGVPLWVAMTRDRPGLIQHELRWDPKLQVRLNLDLKNPSQKEVLESVGSATGMTLTVDGELESATPAYGYLTLPTVRAWAVMGYVAEKQTVRARWRRAEGGYHLQTVSWWRRLDSWLLTPWLLALEAAGLLWVFWPRLKFAWLSLSGKEKAN